MYDDNENENDNDNDYDHAFSQLPVNRALTCPKDRSAWAVAPPWLAKETRSMHDKMNQGVPLRSLAARSEVVLHKFWKGDVFHSGCKMSVS